MPKLKVILENSGGELQWWTADGEQDAATVVINMVDEIEVLHAGDVIRIVDVAT